MKIAMACEKDKTADVEIWLTRGIVEGVSLMIRNVKPEAQDSVFDNYLVTLKPDGTLIKHSGVSGMVGLQTDDEGAVIVKDD